MKTKPTRRQLTKRWLKAMEKGRKLAIALSVKPFRAKALATIGAEMEIHPIAPSSIIRTRACT